MSISMDERDGRMDGLMEKVSSRDECVYTRTTHTDGSGLRDDEDDDDDDDDEREWGEHGASCGVEKPGGEPNDERVLADAIVGETLEWVCSRVSRGVRQVCERKGW
jgi:hypothetical protein